MRRVLAALALSVLAVPTAHAATPQSSVPGLDQSSQAVEFLSGSPLPEVEGGVDLQRFQGKWHQVAAIPQPYTLQCVRNTQADYQLLDPTTVKVVNSCDTPWGQRSVVEGKARVQGPASLRVAFDNVPFQDPNGPTNYRVTYQSADGQVAVVGDPGRASGFILSRERHLSPQQWSELRAVVQNRGWHPCLFVSTPTTGGKAQAQPLCLFA